MTCSRLHTEPKSIQDWEEEPCLSHPSGLQRGYTVDQLVRQRKRILAPEEARIARSFWHN